MQDQRVSAPSEGGDEGRDSASSALIDHIQSASEHQKALLARELHDELGGLLVGAVMDVAWAEQHLNSPLADLKHKLTRARQTLSAAIDLKRRLIEDLRPTLLDNVGLFAALRWHVQATCKRADIPCNIRLPDEERRFVPHIPIALFRIVQEAFAILAVSTSAATVDIEVTMASPTLVLAILTTPTDTPAVYPRQDMDQHSLAAIGYRIEALGGTYEQRRAPSGGEMLRATFPLVDILATTPA